MRLDSRGVLSEHAQNFRSRADTSETRMLINRRHFLLTSSAAGAFALSGCATGTSPRGLTSSAEAAEARLLYDQIFERMLQASPEVATSLGLDTGARAALKYRLGDSSPAGKLGVYQPMVDALPQLAALDRNALQADEVARVDTVRWIAER